MDQSRRTLAKPSQHGPWILLRLPVRQSKDLAFNDRIGDRPGTRRLPTGRDEGIDVPRIRSWFAAPLDVEPKNGTRRPCSPPELAQTLSAIGQVTADHTPDQQRDRAIGSDLPCRRGASPTGSVGSLRRPVRARHAGTGTGPPHTVMMGRGSLVPRARGMSITCIAQRSTSSGSS